jgi:hypothetical protein
MNNRKLLKIAALPALMLSAQNISAQNTELYRETTLDKIYKTSQIVVALIKINADKKKNNKPNVASIIPSNSTNFCIINNTNITISILITPKDTSDKILFNELVVSPNEKECFFNLKPTYYIFSITDTKTGQAISKGEMKLEDGHTFQKTINL